VKESLEEQKRSPPKRKVEENAKKTERPHFARLGAWASWREIVYFLRGSDYRGLSAHLFPPSAYRLLLSAYYPPRPLDTMWGEA
jgi:hypothetical protein